MGLKDKLQALKEEEEQAKVNLTEVSERWQKSVNDLFADVEEWLQDIVDQGLASIEYKDHEIQEHRVPKYKTRVMVIHLGPQLVALEPRGRLIVGAHGRIDFYVMGRKQEGYLLLRFEDGQDPNKVTWQLRSIQDKRAAIPFDKENLERILEGWLEP